MIGIYEQFINWFIIPLQYVFADVVHKTIFTTTDYGRKTWHQTRLQFAPRQLALNKNNYNLILGYDDEDVEKRVSSLKF